MPKAWVKTQADNINQGQIIRNKGQGTLENKADKCIIRICDNDQKQQGIHRRLRTLHRTGEHIRDRRQG